MRLIKFCLFFITLFTCIKLWPEQAYYFQTLDVRDGLSQNTVYQILQDRQGFLWFGTREGLNRYDGLSFRTYRKENSALGKNFITVLYEDSKGFIWVGTDGGVYVYNPYSDSFCPFDRLSDKHTYITDYVTCITGEGNAVWISVENQGLFCYDIGNGKFTHCFYDTGLPNVNTFLLMEDSCWLALYADNLYATSRSFNGDLQPFKDNEGREFFKGDVINSMVYGPHNCVYVGSNAGLTEINFTTRRTRRLLNAYVRTLQFRSDDELWVGTETGLYILHLSDGRKTHLTVPEQDDSYALSDNAIYSLCRDRENGMWIGSYFGGINYYPCQWTYFKKIYPHDNLSYFGRRVREICEGNDGTLWIGTEDKGLFNYNPSSGSLVPFEHPSIYRNVHGLCLDGDELWVGTFSGGLNRVNLETRQVKHYARGERENEMPADDAFAICRTTTGDILIGCTSGLLKYNRATDDFTRINPLKNIFVYDIVEDFNGNLWVATYANGVFCYNVHEHQWKNYLFNEQDSSSLPYNRVVGIYEDSQKRLWFMTLGGGICYYNPTEDDFIRFDISDGLPSNIVYEMVEDNDGNLWMTSNSGLICFNPDKGVKHIYTTANGLLSNHFNFKSGYKDKNGNIYLGSVNGLVIFNAKTFESNDFVPPVVITDFYLFNKPLYASDEGSPLDESITYKDELKLKADQNTFSLQVAVLSYQAPEMNRLEYCLEGFDKEWYSVGRNSMISYSGLPYGNYKLRIRGANSDGTWNPVERQLSICIYPPFYLSIWAYVFYVLLIVFVFFRTFIYYRKKQKRRQKRLMEKFEREKERELYSAKIDFFTNVAHEIRTPLTLIKGPLENVLASKSVPNEIRDDLEIMDLNANRLLDLVNQLLDFRKTESESFRLNFLECNVVSVWQMIYKRFQSSARQKSLTFSVEIPDELYASVDKEAFTKIISNLLTNAIKYAENYIRVRMSIADGQLLLSVSNDGQLVPPDMREEIFKPFVQYKGGSLHMVPGTGIGLALARSLAELHGGSLNMVTNAEDNEFLLLLPLKHKDSFAKDNHLEQQEHSSVEDTEIASNSYKYEGARYTILVVEDSQDMLDFVARQLSFDYHVLTALNGRQALNVLEAETVHLVISDIMMPEMDGLELCAYLKSELDYSHIPVILLTAKTTIQSKIEGLKLGADAYIEKPFSVEYLKVCVANLLSNREKLRKSFAHSPFVEANSMAMNKADETFLCVLNEVVTAHLQDSEFGLDEMSAALHMSRSSLSRKIKGILDMTPGDYVRLERLKKAAQLLKEGGYKINEICYMTGFNTPSYFTKCFQKQFGVLPKDFLTNR